MNTYWESNGKYQEIYNSLWAALVPASGECETVAGEALRCLSKVYYDHYNNKDCNFQELGYYWDYLLHLSTPIPEALTAFRLLDE